MAGHREGQRARVSALSQGVPIHGVIFGGGAAAGSAMVVTDNNEGSGGGKGGSGADERVGRGMARVWSGLGFCVVEVG